MLESLREFLGRPLLAYLSTIDAAGYPHTVPVWFGVDSDDLIFPTMTDRARLRHIAANSKGAVAIGGRPDVGAGYLIKGALRCANIKRDERSDKAMDAREKVASVQRRMAERPET
jgi:predicted pyridoxine 5'-phosphate oxidase superfamily flavin-nucleotide-binding protein